LPGFDTTAALKLLANNIKLYRSVLQRFLGQYSSGYEEIAALISKGEDAQGIQTQAHTIKGLAGTIGNPALYQAALDLEHAFRNQAEHGKDDLDRLGKAFLEQLSSVLKTIQRALAL
jgi:HPt (histidine-containing phosphotransfer) domain-containing protein